MRRRDFLSLSGGAAAWANLARAQQMDRVRKIAILLGIAENDPEANSRVSAFEDGLNELGWRSGQNISIDIRFGGGDRQRIQTFVSELISLRPDIILANSTPVVAALKRQTTTIPIVFAVLNDPVGQGFIDSLSKPGENITGFTFIDFKMVEKWMALLRELSPPVTHAG